MMNSSRTLAKIGAKRSLAEFCGSAQAAHGFQLVRSPFRLNIFGDNLINSLCVGRDRKKRHGRKQRKEKTDYPRELHKRS